VGVVCLLPRKLQLLKRHGNLTTDQLIQLAKNGDKEAARLYRDTKWWIAAALAVGLPMSVIRFWPH
ncbi:MAG: hypothetical protein ABIP34_02440, partial [Rhodoferax sp.]|uniref:hypothetical protein n=1 Tax=Rhodoferax sp. TaxID=50421 RepID=UPI003265B5ED